MKQLRENFSAVKEAIESGQELILIYRSKPLLKMQPIETKPKQPKTVEEKISLINQLGGKLQLKSGWKPDQLNKAYDQEYEEMLP